MKDLKAIRGKFYLARIIEEGEHEHQDFKFAISDAKKIARSLSAFANNDGGRLLVGVKDNGVIAGVRNEEDIYVIEQAAEMYCRPAQQLRFTAITAEDGLIVIRAEIDASPQRPVQALDTDGHWKAYYRVADENILASPLMVKAWRRAESEQPASFNLGVAENAVLHTIQSATEPIDFEEIKRQCHISHHSAEDIIINLYTMGVIDFTFHKRQFMITPKSPESEVYE